MDFEETRRALHGFVDRRVSVEIAADGGEMFACFAGTLREAEQIHPDDDEECWNFRCGETGAFFVSTDLFHEAYWEPPPDDRLVIRQPPVEIAVEPEDEPSADQ